MPSLFFQLLDDFLHLVKNQRDSADSFVWYCSRVENVFFNNCLNWKGLWNALSRAQWQLHFYFIPSRNNKRARGYPMCMCVCLTLTSTCAVKCWRNAICFYGVIFPSLLCAKFLWASALVYRCLYLSPWVGVSLLEIKKPSTSWPWCGR